MRRRALLRSSAGLGLATVLRTGKAQRDGLRVGLTAVILADQAAFLSRWSAYLSERLDTHVGFVTRDEYQTLHDMLATSQIDALWTCGFPFVRFQSQLRLVAVPVYRGQPTYQSYLIRAAGDASIRGWSDLRDRVFAYSDPLSNSGWLVAQAELAKVGIAPRELRRSFFAHSHRNVAEAVAARLAHAGAIDGYVWETMKLQGMNAATRTEVVWKSPAHGFPPIVARHTADFERIVGLRRALLGMDDDAAGRALLVALNLDGFIAGSPDAFESIRRLAASVPGSGVGTP